MRILRKARVQTPDGGELTFNLVAEKDGDAPLLRAA
jgi:hypothetical protein